MIEAYKKFWCNYSNFMGESSRADYWYVRLLNFLIVILICMMGFLIGATTGFEESTDTAFIFMLTGISSIYILATIMPNLAISIRRLRDAGFHWSLIFIQVIPYIGSLVLLILYIMPTAQKNND
ncbi:DUF805 domain-containing protein [Carnobacterium gallinarum]|uniref:DUF805 domain-containing protein n=1 Tax=Carnobacterium gallinarum TaxID=2749 RepID=UPI000552493A|nr:DUF805 domain-containing protein [Carnobacterium gallinarum]